MIRKLSIPFSCTLALLIFPTFTSFSQTLTDSSKHTIALGNLKKSDRVQEGCGCFFRFPAEAKKGKEKYVLISKRNGNPAWTNIDGEDVKLTMKKSGAADMETKVGEKFSRQYEAPGINVLVDFATTWTCAELKDSEGCEVSKYNAVLTVLKNGQKKTMNVVGDCGC